MMDLIGKKLIKVNFPPIYRVWEEKQKRFIEGKKIPLLTKEEKLYYKNKIGFFYHMGYDCVPVASPLSKLLSLHGYSPRITNDTAKLSRVKRAWREEGKGTIK